MKTLRLAIQFVLAIVLVLTPYQALAISSETRQAIDYDAPWYDSRITCDNNAGLASNVPTDLKGNDNIEMAFRYFVDKNLTPEQSAAIIGNLQQESGVNPQSHQGGGGPGRGIAQWSVDGRWPGVIELAKKQGKSEWELSVQLDFIWQEFHTNYASAFNEFLAATSLESMVEVISSKYEVAGKAHIDKRVGYANDVLRLYGNTVTTTDGTASGAIYMVGDSITDGMDTAGMAETLKQAGWQPTDINASWSRSITRPGIKGNNNKPAIDAIADDRAKIKAAAVVFVGLGTNPGPGAINQTTWGSEIDTFVDKLRTYNSTAPIYWLNVISPAIKDKDARNATLNQHATSKSFTVIDATGVVSAFGDTIHPTDYTPLKDFVAGKLTTAQVTANSSESILCGTDGTVGNGEATQYIDGFAIYNQTDPAWSGKPFSTSTIGKSGCGPSAMAMIVTALTGTKVLPPEVAEVAKSMYVEGAGSSHQIGPFVAAHYGLQSTNVGANVAKITEALLAGQLVIAPGGGADPFTKGGHFIVVRGVTANGKWKVGDSKGNGAETSQKEWDPQTLVSQMRPGGVYAISK